jgi:hypothetical protein
VTADTLGMGVVELIIVGEGLEAALREMDMSGLITVVGAGIRTGSGLEAHRIVVRVAAADVAEARELVGQYLPPEGEYSIRPALA